MRRIQWVWTIPNVLSLLRLALIPVFAVLYFLSDRDPVLLYWSIGALVVSGLTDLFDGMIARRFHQITEIGKILDPIADKLTQVTVVLCLAVRMPRLWPLLIVCALKEVLQSVGALVLLNSGAKVQAARWYGKVSTFVFYFAMAMFVAFPPEPTPPLLFGWNMPIWLFGLLVLLVAGCMLFAFYRYTMLFIQVSNQNKKEKNRETKLHSEPKE